jgi:hypothetical protein
VILAELALALGLALAAVWFVLWPILRPESAVGALAAGDPGGDDEVELAPRAVALRALKEIEFDRATGKLADADYAALKAKYTSEALAALRAETGVASPKGLGREPGAGAHTERPAPGSRLPGASSRTPACPDHGPRPESDAEFCSACGRRLASAPGFCARCGAPLPRDAAFCARCGVRVAA